MKNRTMLALGSGVLLGMAGAANAATTDVDVRAEVSALRARVAELEGKQSQTWLNEQRAEEVKALVKEVLADADTRSSLMANGMTAGHNGSNFFLASENNDFLLKISGLLQARYNANFRRGATVAAGSSGLNNQNSGFELHRAQIGFDGHIVSPAWTYAIRLDNDPSSSATYLKVGTIGYQVVDSVNVRVGRDRAPFLREELVDDGYQLAVDRSLINQAFTAGYVEGIFVTWDATDAVKVHLSINDGLRSGEAQGFGGGPLTYQADGNDITATVRGDIKLMGDWKQASDFSAWSEKETAIFVGAAANYQISQTGDLGPNNQNLRWTVDGQLKSGGFNAFAALVYNQQFNDTTLGAQNHHQDQYGVVAQAGYFVVPDKFEPFARYEYLELDNSVASPAGSDVNHIVTAGANYYIAKQRAKVTVDAGYAFGAIPAFSPIAGSPAPGGAGVGNTLDQGYLPDTNRSGQILVRGQVQLMF